MKPPLHVDEFVQHQPRLIILQGLPVISAGMPTDQAYYLISGKAKGKSQGYSERSFATGDMISFISFLALDEYDMDVTATSRCEVLAIARDEIEKQWGSEDIASWIFACSMASDIVKKHNPAMMGYAV